jgi:Domain of unknown function (DUF1929)/Galactose oxidase, central domain
MAKLPKSEKESLSIDKITPTEHKRILEFLNKANSPEDLMYLKEIPPFEEGNLHINKHNELTHKPIEILKEDIANKIIALREKEFPLGFRHIKELLVADINLEYLGNLIYYFGQIFHGKWSVFPQQIPRRGPGGYDGVVHAAMMHTGKVLFITADETTIIWDPEDVSSNSFQNPVNQPHLMPGGYSQLCGHHVFLSSGKLLTVGGGGYGHNSLARWGYIFDPVTLTWTRTSSPMSESKWYPTAVALGDKRVLVVCGHGTGEMDIYDEITDTFSPVTLTPKPFPELYPGMHLLPNHSIFYSRTGWATAGAGGGPFRSASDDQSAFFTLTGHLSGVWTNIATAPPNITDRTKGMSVMLLNNTAPFVRILVIGGADPSTNNTYSFFDATALTPIHQWGNSILHPDGEHRSLASAVLLPDGNVFVCGGIQHTNSPCTMFNPEENTWSKMANLPSTRDYHSVAFLLPSGKVAMAGWNNTNIEVFSPPYLFRGTRPTITNAPTGIHYNVEFSIESPETNTISRAVLVRPMAITHQTDTEQKVIELSIYHDHTKANTIVLTPPHATHPNSFAQTGYYMLFILNTEGVPSIAKWVYLH